MASPQSFRQKVREEARKAINRAIERDEVTETEIEQARREFDLTNYQDFFANCRTLGKTTERCGALWNRLKELGEAPVPDETSGEGSSNAATTSSRSGSGASAKQPSGGTTATNLDELEDEMAGADAVYLVITSGCPSCTQAKQALKEFIDNGLVETVDPATSDIGADIILETDISALPTLVMENNGTFTEI